MSEEKHYTGSDVAQAIAIACQDLGTTQDKLNIEVIAAGSAGFFGLFGKKKASVKVSFKKKGRRSSEHSQRGGKGERNRKGPARRSSNFNRSPEKAPAEISQVQLDEVKSDLKRLLVENLCLEDVNPQDITDDMNLFGEEGLGLDSLDGVEIVVILQRRYGLDVKDLQKGREVFRSINTLAPYVLANALE